MISSYSLPYHEDVGDLRLLDDEENNDYRYINMYFICIWEKPTVNVINGLGQDSRKFKIIPV